MKFSAVCMDCRHREVGCHSVCPIYLEAKQEYDAKKDLICEAKKREKDANCFRRDGMMKNIREKRRDKR